MVGRRHSGWGMGAAALALLLASGCATSRGAPPSEAALGKAAESAQLVETPVGTFRLEVPRGDLDAEEKLRAALEFVGPKLTRWGTLKDTVTVRVLPDHKALERAAGHSGAAWLRAWARYDVVDVQAPRTWGLFGATQNDVNELMLHEVTHSLMYQLASDREHWRRTGIPVWFREGMASYTAEQGYRWPTLEALSRYMHDNPGSEPLQSAAELVEKESALAYGAGHHAFTFLVKRYGEASVRALLRDISRGSSFSEAFTHAVGLPPEAFIRDFDRYVLWRGFKGGRVLKRQARVPAAE